MIPKKLHYIWLGGKPLPKIAEKCIASWKKYCPDYEIIRWDESNLDLNKYQYAKDAYEAKKYAFASDVFRFDILNEYGGIYLDIDVELLKNIDLFLNNTAFVGYEKEDLVNPGLIFGAKQKSKITTDILTFYKNLLFVNYGKNDNNVLTVCTIMTDYLRHNGLKCNDTYQKIDELITVYPIEYFCPKSTSDGKIRKTKNTYSIHHYLGSWTTKKSKVKMKFLQFIKRLIGEKNVKKLRKWKKIKEVNNEKKHNKAFHN